MQNPTEKYNRRIRTNLYQDQRFSEAELELLHTPSLQRLYDLRQLGLADRVFIDASHTRLAHVIGVMEIAAKMVVAIKRNLAKAARTRGELQWSTDAKGLNPISCNELKNQLDERLAAIRLIALLHDLTHAPYGHTLEDEIELVHPPHDAPSRQADAFRKLVHELIAWLAKETFDPNEIVGLTSSFPYHKTLGGLAEPDSASDDAIIALGIRLIDRGSNGHVKALPPEQLAELLSNINFASRALYYLELSHKFKQPDPEVLPKESYPANEILERILRESKLNSHARRWQQLDSHLKSEAIPHFDRFHSRRDAYCLDIIGDTICADLLDYAQRDSVQAGLPLAFDLNRIIDNFTIISHEEPDSKEPECKSHPFNGSCLRAAVDFSSGKFRGDAIGELIELLQVRYYVYERMLFHPTKCVAGGMLGSAIQLLGFKQIPPEWQKTGDAVFLQSIREVSSTCQQVIERATEDGKIKLSSHFEAGVFKKVMDLLSPWNVGAIRNTRELLRQRLLTLEEIRSKFAGPKPAQLWMSRLLHGDNRLPQHHLLIIEALSEALYTTPKLKAIDGAATVDGGLFKLLLDTTYEQALKRAQRPSEITSAIVANVLTDTLHLSLKHILDDLVAADETMSCLLARRYARRVFCLMPANIVAKNIPVDVTIIAERFLNPEVRFAAERTIERICQLSKGSVVIHCPPATGPRKIARVLTTYIPPLPAEESPPANPESRRQTVQLKDIGSIKGPANALFNAHHNHVGSLEKMYSSMWRLWVAVLPPDDIAHATISAAISKVIAAVVFDGGAYVTVSNDVFMVEEMNLKYSRVDESEPLEKTPAVAPVPQLIEPADTAISFDELKMLLGAYLSIFSSRKQRTIEKTILSDAAVASIAQRATPVEIARLRSCRIPFSFASPEWDARDAEAYCTKIAALANFRHLELGFENEPRVRRLNREEKEFMAKIAAVAKAEVSGIDLITKSGATSLSKIATENGINVIFQPLLCSGLFGVVEGKPTILIDSGPDNPDELAQRHVAREEPTLLPHLARKTLAHELMHFFVHRAGRKVVALGVNQERIATITEAFCEDAAEALLLPESLIISFLRDAPFSVSKTLVQCEKLGVAPDVLIRAIAKAPFLDQITRGVGFILGKSAGNGRLHVIEAACSRALTTKAATLRDLSRGVPLPFMDILSEGIGELTEDLEIEATRSSNSAKCAIVVNMARISPAFAAANLRLIVVQA